VIGMPVPLRRLRVLWLILALVAASFPARAAVEIQEVTSPGGITAWLVEDYTVPIIAVRFAFEGGASQDPDGREGLANLMTGLFDEGAGDLDSDAFQIRLDELGAAMRFDATRDAIYGQIRMLADDRQEAMELLRLALSEPRFDEEPLERIRSQIVTSIVADERNPLSQGRLAFARALYGDHPYARRSDGSVASVQAATADELRAFHRRNFARSNLTVAVVGAIDAETLSGVLDEVFGELPEQAELATVPRADIRLAQEVATEYPLPQTTLQLVFPGVARDDPEFFGAFLMNQILGGGTFSSRLFREVREMRGLSYGVSSSLQNGDYADLLVVGTSTRSDRTQETLSVIRDVLRSMVEEGPTEEELALAKTYVIGAYAINNLDSSSAIARTLVELQRDDLGIDYIERREDLINSVTLEQVAEAARRLLSADPALMLIGPALQGGG
jgi:zinc protease